MGRVGRAGVEFLPQSPFGIHRHGRRGDRRQGDGLQRTDSLRDGLREEGFVESRYGRDRHLVGRDDSHEGDFGGRLLDGCQRGVERQIPPVRVLGARLHHPRASGRPGLCGG